MATWDEEHLMTEEDLAIFSQLRLDWLLYGEMHVTNADGLTRLDPRGVTYSPPNTANRTANKPCPCGGQHNISDHLDTIDTTSGI